MAEGLFSNVVVGNPRGAHPPPPEHTHLRHPDCRGQGRSLADEGRSSPLAGQHGWGCLLETTKIRWCWPREAACFASTTWAVAAGSGTQGLWAQLAAVSRCQLGLPLLRAGCMVFMVLLVVVAGCVTTSVSQDPAGRIVSTPLHHRLAGGMRNQVAKAQLAAIMSPLTTSLAAWSTTAGREEVMDRFPRDVVFLLDRSSAKTSKWSTATSLVLVLHQARHRLHV